MQQTESSAPAGLLSTRSKAISRHGPLQLIEWHAVCRRRSPLPPRRAPDRPGATPSVGVAPRASSMIAVLEADEDAPSPGAVEALGAVPAAARIFSQEEFARAEAPHVMPGLVDRRLHVSIEACDQLPARRVVPFVIVCTCSPAQPDARALEPIGHSANIASRYEREALLAPVAARTVVHQAHHSPFGGGFIGCRKVVHGAAALVADAEAAAERA
eukprot:CAMPEP_0119058978 /NCGR_PEP_ID=MMETSP1178-20130426/3212_1 /TAXON_ID=33656 /ORGANISM="unid sp, Strain CCMP2000" /LENGTH=214 /DNA_ID=CAMNT_0007039973 /DNA_START=18 /DNA_END=663 /DNA_ORIENTATION=+